MELNGTHVDRAETSVFILKMCIFSRSFAVHNTSTVCTSSTRFIVLGLPVVNRSNRHFVLGIDLKELEGAAAEMFEILLRD